MKIYRTKDRENILSIEFQLTSSGFPTGKLTAWWTFPSSAMVVASERE
jgi:hypothetical protein